MKPEITLENYEVYALDYLEGQLDESQRAAFEHFLLSNPNLSEQLEGIAELCLPADQTRFAQKYSLKKSTLAPDLPFLDEQLIGLLEHDLSPQDEEHWRNEIAGNPQLAKQWRLISQTRLTADTSIIFPDKDSLHRQGLIRKMLRYAVPAAAALVLAVTLLPHFNTLQPEATALRHRDTLPAAKPPKTHTINLLSPEKNILAQSEIIQPKDPDTLTSDWYTEVTYTQISLVTEAAPSVETTATYRLRLNSEPSNKPSESRIAEHNPRRLFRMKREEVKPVTLLAVAEKGIGSLAEKTGANVQLKHEATEGGKLKSLHFETGWFAYTKINAAEE